MLSDWGTKGQGLTWEWFQIWEMSGYHQLPFEGSFVSQPSYVQYDFKRYLQLKRWWRMNNERPSTDGVPMLD